MLRNWWPASTGIRTERRAEVEDFIDFLQTREADQHLARAASRASEPAFKAVWDNPDDADYDRL